MKIGVTAGAFDMCHAGHVQSFKEASENCDFLIVLLHRDPSLERPEKNAPIMSVAERRGILEGIKYIDLIIEYDLESDLQKLLEGVKPKIRFLGKDWMGKPYTGHQIPIEIFWHDRSHGHSSSELRKRVYDQERKKRGQEEK